MSCTAASSPTARARAVLPIPAAPPTRARLPCRSRAARRLIAEHRELALPSDEEGRAGRGMRTIWRAGHGCHLPFYTPACREAFTRVVSRYNDASLQK